MKILILGDTGLIGSALVQKLINHHDIIGLSRSTAHFDYEHIAFNIESTGITSLLESTQPQLIISALRGDFDQQLQRHHEILTYSKQHQIPIHFYSTANVFDGSNQTIHGEMDQTISVSPYGNFKIEVENLIKTLPSYAIIRLPMVFGKDSPRFKEIQKILITQEKLKVLDLLELSIVLDTYIADIHALIIERNLSGIFHITSQDTISMKAFYQSFLGNDIIIESIPPQIFALKSTQELLLEQPLDVQQVVSTLNTHLKQ
ncbi:MAG: sugar nucleotide-binding protein [Clostridia bacterium]|nr:sugar nucleotide-binding protein [Clostridia bacterium]